MTTLTDRGDYVHAGPDFSPQFTRSSWWGKFVHSLVKFRQWFKRPRVDGERLLKELILLKWQVRTWAPMPLIGDKVKFKTRWDSEVIEAEMESFSASFDKDGCHVDILAHRKKAQMAGTTEVTRYEYFHVKPEQVIIDKPVLAPIMSA